MTLINFALEDVGTEISCDKVSSDGYEPSNLLKSRQKSSWGLVAGFMAERFLKPPVSLTLKFACPVNISHVVLDPQVGSQKSSWIEIYTAVKLSARQYRTEKFVLAVKSVANAARNIADGGDNKQVNLPEPVFKKIGSVQCVEPGRVCLWNPHFQSNPSFTVNKATETYQHNVELRHHQWVMLAAADFLCVRIVRTVSGSLAALGKLEIWGQPAPSCSPHVRTEMFTRFAIAQGQQINQRSDSLSQQSSMDQKTENVKEKAKADSQSSLDDSASNLGYGVPVPEEFLDLLTFEIMSVPMLLPSGHSIDLITLEKFKDVEATYGRQPSDPFTGVMFTDSKRPVPNTSLKMRIDRFLMEHPDEPTFKNVPRMVGRRVQGVNKLTDGSLISAFNNSNNVLPAKPVERTVGSAVKVLKRTLLHNRSSDIQNRCDRHGNSVCSCNTMNREAPPALKKQRLDVPGIKQEPTSLLSEQTLNTDRNRNRTSTVVNSAQTYEDRLKSNLQEALSSVLQGLPSFSFTSSSSMKGRIEQVKNKSMACGYCSVKLTELADVNGFVSNTLTYKFPCEHLICRSCLLATGNDRFITCPVCHGQFMKSAVTRKYV